MQSTSHLMIEVFKSLPALQGWRLNEPARRNIGVRDRDGFWVSCQRRFRYFSRIVSPGENGIMEVNGEN